MTRRPVLDALSALVVFAAIVAIYAFLLGVSIGSYDQPLSRFVCQKSVAKYIEQPRLAFAAGTAEGVNRRTDPDINKTALLEHTPPACARQATSNSVSP
jgi:hypothetical protein